MNPVKGEGKASSGPAYFPASSFPFLLQLGSILIFSRVDGCFFQLPLSSSCGHHPPHAQSALPYHLSGPGCNPSPSLFPALPAAITELGLREARSPVVTEHRGTELGDLGRDGLFGGVGVPLWPGGRGGSCFRKPLGEEKLKGREGRAVPAVSGQVRSSLPAPERGWSLPQGPLQGPFPSPDFS